MIFLTYSRKTQKNLQLQWRKWTHTGNLHRHILEEIQAFSQSWETFSSIPEKRKMTHYICKITAPETTISPLTTFKNVVNIE